ncbi:MAG: carbonic anhydrase [Candidatus Sericytochromatia bacterium]|nr:carbonic anhydrase [Candidatus Sericytochromatia bacterium]
MRKLVEGVQKFKNQVFDEHRELFAKLALGQAPEALFITCADSRISPSLLTQSKPGEIFIIRNAGNIVPPHGAANGGEGATVEYAVAVLGVKDIIVCGHSDCGAMKAVLKPETLDELPTVRAWLNHAETTRRIVRTKHAHLEGQDRVDAAIEENVLVQLEHLRTLPSVAVRLAKGDLRLHAWVYQIDTGAIRSFDAMTGRFVPLTDSGTETDRVAAGVTA